MTKNITEKPKLELINDKPIKTRVISKSKKQKQKEIKPKLKDNIEIIDMFTDTKTIRKSTKIDKNHVDLDKKTEFLCQFWNVYNLKNMFNIGNLSMFFDITGFPPNSIVIWQRKGNLIGFTVKNITKQGQNSVINAKLSWSYDQKQKCFEPHSWFNEDETKLCGSIINLDSSAKIMIILNKIIN
jgi:hypothetical protein